MFVEQSWHKVASDCEQGSFIIHLTCGVQMQDLLILRGHGTIPVGGLARYNKSLSKYADLHYRVGVNYGTIQERRRTIQSGHGPGR